MGRARSFVVNSAVVLATLTVAFAFPPSTAQEPLADAERTIVSFYEWPELREGDSYRGMRVVRTLPSLHIAVVEPERGTASNDDLRRDENVRYVEPDAVLVGLTGYTPNDPRYGDQYGPQQVKANLAWDRTLGTTARTVCITDTGVRYTHEDIAGARWLGGIDTINDDDDPWDDNGHGTHVTGIAAAAIDNGKGVAGVGNVAIKGVKLIAANDSSTASALADGVRWCRDHGTHVTNSSWGGSSICSSASIRDAFQYASDGGLLNVASAGNNGGSIECPAVWPTVVAVTCTTSTKALCSFSSRGPDAELAAPGLGVLSTSGRAIGGTNCVSSDTGYCNLSGTSMSSPHVAGVAALVWSHDSATTRDQFRTALQESAEDLGAAGRDNLFGFGLVDAAAALGALNEPPTALAGEDVTVSDGDAGGDESVTLDGAGSFDGDGDDSIVLYEWLENGVLLSTAVAPTLPFALGVHEVTLRVTDETARTGTDTVRIVVNPNQAPVASAVVSCGGLDCSFSGAPSSDADGTLLDFAWTFGDGGSANGLGASHPYAEAGTYAATLTVTDNGGAADAVTFAVTVPGGPEVSDVRLDLVGDTTGPSWMDVLSVDFSSDATNLVLRMRVRDIAPDPRTTAQVAYHVLFTPQYAVSDLTWGGNVPDDASFMGLRAQALYSPGRPDAPLANSISSTVFQVQVLYRDGNLNVFDGLATVAGTVDAAGNAVTWTIPRAVLQGPAAGAILGTTGANAVPAVGGVTTFGVGFGDQTGAGAPFVFS